MIIVETSQQSFSLQASVQYVFIIFSTYLTYLANHVVPEFLRGFREPRYCYPSWLLGLGVGFIEFKFLGNNTILFPHGSDRRRPLRPMTPIQPHIFNVAAYQLLCQF